MSNARWCAATPDDARRWLASADCDWWIAGGQALALWIGRPTRPHADLDVGCWRDDLDSVRAALPGWEVHVASEGMLRRLRPEDRPAAVEHALWCRPEGAGVWWLEILLEDREGGDWVFRRERRIRRPLDRVVLARGGIRFLCPEVQLLYKAKQPRARDEGDLRRVLPTLDRTAVEWLRQALDQVHPGHPWIALLAAPTG